MKLITGLDPGGKNSFGWCISENNKSFPLQIRCSGVANHAQEALDSIIRCIQNDDQIEAAGIDAPLFWTPEGDRKLDQLLRPEIKRKGGSTSTIMSVNSLQGACLVQGVIAGQLIG